MVGFGSIHELSVLESTVRRTLQAAAHEVYCAIDLLSQDEEDRRNRQAKEMLERAMVAIKKVIGD